MNGELDLKDRIKSVIGAYSVSSFARKCGISESLMRQYLSGATPGTDKLVAIADAAGVEIAWLAAGRGPMRRTEGVKGENSTGDGSVKDYPEINAALVFEVMKATEEFLDKQGQILPPGKFTKLVKILCRMLVDKQRQRKNKGESAPDNVINMSDFKDIIELVG